MKFIDNLVRSLIPTTPKWAGFDTAKYLEDQRKAAEGMRLRVEQRMRELADEKRAAKREARRRRAEKIRSSYKPPTQRQYEYSGNDFPLYFDF